MYNVKDLLTLRAKSALKCRVERRRRIITYVHFKYVHHKSYMCSVSCCVQHELEMGDELVMGD